MPNILLSGACGRMGRVTSGVCAQADFSVAAGVDIKAEKYGDFPVYPTFSAVKEPIDVVVDFSRPDSLPDLLAFCVRRRLPVVLAATGYTETDERLITSAAQQIAVFRSANMSVGVYALKLLSRMASELLPGFDIEIVEKHHNQKLDAPSGTAMALYDAVSVPENRAVYGRSGRNEKREARDIGMHAVRGGTVTGEHEMGFYGQGETLLITHIAQDRVIFALGALKAARFLLSQTRGEYGMDDLFAVCP